LKAIKMVYHNGHHGKLYKFTCKYSNKKYVIINFGCATKKLCV